MAVCVSSKLHSKRIKSDDHDKRIAHQDDHEKTPPAQNDPKKKPLPQCDPENIPPPQEEPKRTNTSIGVRVEKRKHQGHQETKYQFGQTISINYVSAFEVQGKIVKR